jgi:hypothetical protein
MGIRTPKDMLDVGKTEKGRTELAKKSEIPSDSIMELVKLSVLILKAKLVDIANSVLNAGIFQNLIANVASFARDQVLLDETILTLVPVSYKACCSENEKKVIN